jgi:hypothetical protein
MCEDCHHNNERQRAFVAKEADENKISILQLYYAALIQYHTAPALSRSQDSDYLHCT